MNKQITHGRQNSTDIRPEVAKPRQREELIEKLMEIRPDVSAKDRRDYEEESGVTDATISRYLNGKVATIDRGLDMFVFFSKRISARNKIIEANTSTNS